MPFDGLLQVGRDASYRLTPNIQDTGVVNEDILIGGTETHSLSFTSLQRLTSVQVSVSPSSAGGVPAGAVVGGFINIKVDGVMIASYTLPSSNNWGYSISEIIPLNMEVNNSIVKLEIGSASGTSYNVFLRLVATALPL